MELKSSYKQFGGHTNYYTHESKVCGGPMNFAAFLPTKASSGKVPVLYWLSGLTCSEENFITKAYGQIFAEEFGVCLIAPDTSPRTAGVAGENDSYDLGIAAGFYVDATQGDWAKCYNMYTYITEELRELVEAKLPIDPSKAGIFGHSMGGHGALVLGLRNPNYYKSISAFAPICAPTHCAWGEKAFTNYLGTDKAAWAKYDANELIQEVKTRTPILIDQGLDDEFLADQLETDRFEATCKENDYPVQIRRQAGYDHSYFFISTFIRDHIKFHMENF